MEYFSALLLKLVWWSEWACLEGLLHSSPVVNKLWLLVGECDEDERFPYCLCHPLGAAQLWFSSDRDSATRQALRCARVYSVCVWLQSVTLCCQSDPWLYAVSVRTGRKPPRQCNPQKNTMRSVYLEPCVQASHSEEPKQLVVFHALFSPFWWTLTQQQPPTGIFCFPGAAGGPHPWASWEESQPSASDQLCIFTAFPLDRKARFVHLFSLPTFLFTSFQFSFSLSPAAWELGALARPCTWELGYRG